nr:MAG TPA: hypothetical protein [Caudoviricetes sp.]
MFTNKFPSVKTEPLVCTYVHLWSTHTINSFHVSLRFKYHTITWDKLKLHLVTTINIHYTSKERINQ